MRHRHRTPRYLFSAHVACAALAAAALAGCALEDEPFDPEALDEHIGETSSEISNQYVTAYSGFGFPSGTFYNKDIHITMERDPGRAAYFFAHQFGFQDSGGYIGLQTDSDGGGKIAIFSIWNATGALKGSDGTWCEPFGNEGVGYSCRMRYDWKPGRTYRLRVWAFSQTSWGAWIMDTSTGAEVFLGRIYTPSSHGWLAGDSIPFTEYFGPDFGSCDDLPLARVRWHAPTANNGSVGSSWTGNWLGGGACQHLRGSIGRGPTVHSIGSRVLPDCTYLYGGGSLYPGERLRSCDARFSLDMQNDGNLVLYQTGVGALWHAGTHGTSGLRTVMQGDGNLVLYDVFGRALWHTGTYHYPGARLAVQNDGNMVVYDSSWVPRWASNTCCR